MNYNDIIGTIGVGLILMAYFLNTAKLIQNNGKLYYVMNIFGAALACYASSLSIICLCDIGRHLDTCFYLWIDEGNENKNNLGLAYRK